MVCGLSDSRGQCPIGMFTSRVSGKHTDNRRLHKTRGCSSHHVHITQHQNNVWYHEGCSYSDTGRIVHISLAHRQLLEVASAWGSPFLLGPGLNLGRVSTYLVFSNYTKPFLVFIYIMCWTGPQKEWSCNCHSAPQP